MQKYRKKPVVIDSHENWQHGNIVEGVEIGKWNGDDISGCGKCEKPMYLHGKCPTLEGHHIVCPGDWVIKGVKGEFYPCKPDIFEMTYEVANANSKSQ